MAYLIWKHIPACSQICQKTTLRRLPPFSPSLLYLSLGRTWQTDGEGSEMWIRGRDVILKSLYSSVPWWVLWANGGRNMLATSCGPAVTVNEAKNSNMRTCEAFQRDAHQSLIQHCICQSVCVCECEYIWRNCQTTVACKTQVRCRENTWSVDERQWTGMQKRERKQRERDQNKGI